MKDVLDVYTMPQVVAFVVAANENMEEEFFSRATSMRIGMASEKGWSSFVQSKKYREAKKSGKTITPRQAQTLTTFLGGKRGGTKGPNDSRT